MTASAIDALDGCAGPGGWSLAAAALGIRELGIELDPWACATRAAAGHLTVRADVAAFPVTHLLRRIRGLIFSPPCGTFSAAGKGEGVGDMPLLHQALDDLAADRDTRAPLAAACSDPRTPLVVEPLRYALAIRPEWIALEQVPAVLPLWRHIARILRGLGYSAWAGILNAADFGVPQTRQRAILIASRVHQVAPPEATHAKVAEPDTLFGPGRARWVSMAEALGWASPLAAGVVNTRGERKTPGGNEFSPAGPSWALTEKARSWTVRTNSGNGDAHDYERDLDQPSPSLTSRSDRWRVDVGAGGFAEGWTRGIDEPSPTIRNQAQSWVLRTSFGEPKDDRKNGSHEMDPAQRPAHTLTGRAKDWRLVSGQSVAGEGRAERGMDEPAVSITGRADLCSFRLRVGSRGGVASRTDAEPAPTLLFGHHLNDVSWTAERPATTVAATDRVAKPGHRDRKGGERQFEDSVRISIQEAAVLQSFPADYPWQDTKTQAFLQCGNAVPPLLALHILSAAAGIDLADAVERAA